MMKKQKKFSKKIKTNFPLPAEMDVDWKTE